MLSCPLDFCLVWGFPGLFGKISRFLFHPRTLNPADHLSKAFFPLEYIKYVRLGILYIPTGAQLSRFPINEGWAEINASLGQGKLCTAQSRFSEAEAFLTRGKDAYGHAFEHTWQQYTQELLEDLYKKRDERQDVVVEEEEDSDDGEN
ncbi:hypothetical protein B0H17DRAFT_1150031 [Mycena rosella]|uniref:Uncharacterized protein n=1 Tax=Mycena rosella TaxID=1033263 RepID=A0AAD7BVG6_MYCRO|nr:hypothetical protein B0H17DRAFT_1150031 [Mycena rosella]